MVGKLEGLELGLYVGTYEGTSDGISDISWAATAVANNKIRFKTFMLLLRGGFRVITFLCGLLTKPTKINPHRCGNESGVNADWEKMSSWGSASHKNDCCVRQVIEGIVKSRKFG